MLYERKLAPAPILSSPLCKCGLARYLPPGILLTVICTIMKKILFLSLLMIGLAAAELQAKPFIVTGRMEYAAELEGGCWYLGAEDGAKYQILGTESELRQIQVIGRNVKLKVVAAPNMASTCMIGKIVRIVEVLDVIGYPVDQTYTTVRAKGRVYKMKNGCWYLKTSQGHKYDLELANIPKSKRRNGARVNQMFKIYMDSSASECGLAGKALFVPSRLKAPIERAKEKMPSDPR